VLEIENVCADLAIGHDSFHHAESSTGVETIHPFCIASCHVRPFRERRATFSAAAQFVYVCYNSPPPNDLQKQDCAIFTTHE
jgi:hypothetical protein